MATALPTSAASASLASAIDARALMRIKGLELRAKVVVEGFFSGLHRSPYHGFSVEFTEYRQYSPGDDPRYLDWKLYARSDRYFIKRFEDETNLRCHLLVDQSRSMGYGSLDYTKAEYATTLAATLAYFLHTQRDATGAVTFDEEIVDYLPPRYRPGHLRRLMLMLERPVSGKGTNLVAPLDRVAEIVRKRGMIILISDLLAPVDQLGTQLGSLVAQGHELVLFHVLDPAETNFDFEAPTLFEDLETGRELYIDPQQVRQQYIERFGQHLAGVQRECEKLGVEYHHLTTDRPLEYMLFDFLQQRMERGKKVRRLASRRREAPA